MSKNSSNNGYFYYHHHSGGDRVVVAPPPPPPPPLYHHRHHKIQLCCDLRCFVAKLVFSPAIYAFLVSNFLAQNGAGVKKWKIWVMGIYVACTAIRLTICEMRIFIITHHSRHKNCFSFQDRERLKNAILDGGSISGFRKLSLYHISDCIYSKRQEHFLSIALSIWHFLNEYF